MAHSTTVSSVPTPSSLIQNCTISEREHMKFLADDNKMLFLWAFYATITAGFLFLGVLLVWLFTKDIVRQNVLLRIRFAEDREALIDELCDKWKVPSWGKSGSPYKLEDIPRICGGNGNLIKWKRPRRDVERKA
jgi:hypothetical protein